MSNGVILIKNRYPEDADELRRYPLLPQPALSGQDTRREKRKANRKKKKP